MYKVHGVKNSLLGFTRYLYKKEYEHSILVQKMLGEETDLFYSSGNIFRKCLENIIDEMEKEDYSDEEKKEIETQFEELNNLGKKSNVVIVEKIND